MHAQRLLVERGERDIVPELVALVNDPSVDPIGLNPSAIHALWTLHGLGALDGTTPAATASAIAALKHPSAGVRRNAVQVLPAGESSAEAILRAKLLDDPEALVRLAALLALADQPGSQASAESIAGALSSGRAEGDRWLGDAATSAASVNDRAFLTAINARAFPRKGPGETTLGVVRRVAEHYARGGPAGSVATLLAALPGAHRRVAEEVVAGLAQGWPKDRTATLDPTTEAALVRFLPSISQTARGQLVRLAGGWGGGALEKYAAEIAAELKANVADEAKPDAARADAARQWVELRPADDVVVLALLDQVTPRVSPELATGLLEAIGRSVSSQGGRNLADRLGSLTPAAPPRRSGSFSGGATGRSRCSMASRPGKSGSISSRLIRSRPWHRTVTVGSPTARRPCWAAVVCLIPTARR